MKCAYIKEKRIINTFNAMNRLLKELAWKVPIYILWSQCTWFAKYDKPFWSDFVIAFVFFIMLDLVRWGLKK